MTRGHLFAYVVVALALPFFVSAQALSTSSGQVVITKITYDPVGADPGHEWIELQNTGTSTIQLTDFKLRTSGTNHKIVALEGDGTLGTQAHAAITQDAGLFATDVPSFDGAVFHASFSLTNTSGTVEIVDKTGFVIASKSYQAPPPIPKPVPVRQAQGKKQKTVKTKKVASNPISNDTAPSSDITDTTTQVEADAAATAGAAASAPVSSSSSIWLIGAIGLAGAAGLATFYARHTAKREWDIVEEKDEEV